MLERFGKLSAVTALVVVVAGNLAAAEAVQIGGTGSATGTIKEVGEAFTAASEIPVEVVTNLGSSGGIRAVADGVVDIAVSGRALKPDEIAAGLTQIVFARTPFVLVTSHRSPNGLKSVEVAKIFKSVQSTWSDGTPIRIILRPRSESDTKVLGELFPGVGAAIEAARLRPDVPVAGTDQDNADMAEAVEGSLVGATFTQIKSEKRNLRFVALDGVEPTLENFENGTYPFGKTLYLITSVNKSPKTERFLAFLQSPQGMKILRATGNIPGAVQ